MRGRNAGTAEIVGRSHDAAAKMLLPEAVHHHAGVSGFCLPAIHAANCRRRPSVGFTPNSANQGRTNSGVRRAVLIRNGNRLDLSSAQTQSTAADRLFLPGVATLPRIKTRVSLSGRPHSRTDKARGKGTLRSSSLQPRWLPAVEPIFFGTSPRSVRLSIDVSAVLGSGPPLRFARLSRWRLDFRSDFNLPLVSVSCRVSSVLRACQGAYSCGVVSGV